METCSRATPRDIWALSSWEPPWEPLSRAAAVITIRLTCTTAVSDTRITIRALTPTVQFPTTTRSVEHMDTVAERMARMAAPVGEHPIIRILELMREELRLPPHTAADPWAKPTTPIRAPM